MKITKKTKLSEILEKNPKAGEILLESGLHCISCPFAVQESLEAGCLAHGMDEKEIKKLIEKLNNLKQDEPL